MANEIITAVKQGLEGDKMRLALEKALPKGIDPKRLIQISITALTKSPKLMQCDKLTIYDAVMECAQLGLIPDGILGDAYFVPYKGKCQLIPGYRGLMRLAVRSGKVSHVFPDVVYSNDVFIYERGQFPVLKHVPYIEGERGEFVGAYAVANMIDDPNHPAFEFMPAWEINKIRDGSQGYKYQKQKGGTDNPWISNEDEMRKKTAVRRLCKFLPLSPEAMTAAIRGEYYDAGTLGMGDRQSLTPGTENFGFKKPDDKKPPTKPAKVTSVETPEPDEPEDENPFPEGEEPGEETPPAKELTQEEIEAREALQATYVDLCQMAKEKRKRTKAWTFDALQAECERLTKQIEDKG